MNMPLIHLLNLKVNLGINTNILKTYNKTIQYIYIYIYIYHSKNDINKIIKIHNMNASNFLAK